MLDWAANPEHLQSILLKYNPVGASTKPTMLKSFQKDLKPFVLAELEYRDLELESFDQMVKKAVNAKAKLAFQPWTSTKEMDQYYPRANQLVNSTMSQGSTMKDPRSEKPKVWVIESLSNLQCSESSKKARIEKKKKQRPRDQERQEGSTPVVDVNAAQAKPHQKM